VIEGCRRVHNERHNFYPSSYIIREDIGGACSMHGRDEKCLQNFYRKN
jgi:hypothetical protein